MADCIDEAFLESCSRLQIIAATLKGYDSYDVEACTRHGVWLTIVPESIIPPTAELALALTLAVMRNVRSGDEVVRSGDFAGWRPALYGATLSDAVVGMLGMGQLGQAVAKLLSAFGIAELLYVDEDEKELHSNTTQSPTRRVDLDTLFSTSDVIIVTLPLTSSTHHLVDAALLAQLRPGSRMINAGRGSVIDKAAVLEVLQSGRMAGYAADVFEMEDWAFPTRPKSILKELREHPRTVLTPHLGSAVDSVRREMSLTSARQVRQVLVDGQRPQHAVNSPWSKPRIKKS